MDLNSLRPVFTLKTMDFWLGGYWEHLLLNIGTNWPNLSKVSYMLNLFLRMSLHLKY